MVKVAVIADVHGNYTALQAVLADAKQQQVDEYLILGDITNRGPAPQECVAALQAVKPLAWVIGNHEEVYRSLLNHDFVNFQNNDKAIMAVVTSAFDRQQLGSQAFRWLAERPLCQTVKISGVEVRVFHATPKSCRGHLTIPTAPQENFDALLADSTAQIALYGHTHQKLLRQTTDGRYVINPGSVGQSVSPQINLAAAQAAYVILTFENKRLADCDFKNIPYDSTAETSVAEKRQLPFQRLYTFLLATGTFTFTSANVHKENQAHNYPLLAEQLIEKDKW
ncbi:metallophosphoesterase family protein [Liquorilactobacillus sicerae]|uniref:metallophosphoesterase family protein n=1 Tax=Liquorilactobacillus sicerae TaxID=1416943 RepID=UPI0024818B45|nr:metallophosphoesterase family protein [Liquorilactobacillus sicerae]